MTSQEDLKKMSMSALIARYNEVASKIGKDSVTEFKSLSFARSEVTRIETMETQAQTPTVDTSAQAPADGAQATAPVAGGTVTHTADSKYDSRDKRGPNQGVGAYAKELLLLGKSNADVLAGVTEKFPTAKTSKGCIAFYRTALQRDGKLAKGGGVIPQDPAAMLAKAASMKAEAEKLEAEAKAEADKQAAAKAEAEAKAAAEAKPAEQVAAAA